MREGSTNLDENFKQEDEIEKRVAAMKAEGKCTCKNPKIMCPIHQVKKENRDNESEEEKLERQIKERKKAYKTIAIFILVILVIGGISFGISKLFFKPGIPEGSAVLNVNGEQVIIKENQSLQIGEHIFKRTGGLWVTRLKVHLGNTVRNVYDFVVRYSPPEVMDIPVDENVKSRILNADFIYYTTEPDTNAASTMGMVEVGRIIGDKYNIFNKPTRAALTEPGHEVPWITCNNATDGVVVMHFTNGNETAVRSNGNCIMLTGVEDLDMIKAADRVLYSLIDILQ